MANSKSDKPLVRNLIIGCVVAILIFHFAWFRQLTVNLHDWLFVIGDIILIALFGYSSGKAYKLADDPNNEWLRWATALLAVAICAWAGGWAAYVNEKVL